MKKIKLGAITLAICLLLVGCSDPVSNNSDAKASSNTSYKSNEIEDTYGNNITATEYIDESTGVYYLIVQEYQRAISVTPMYNADGTLKISK